jgi:4-carboxymuconolactone decarboxylase
MTAPNAGPAPTPRIRPITKRDGLTGPQQAAFDAVVGSRGKVIGPFTVLLHRPELASAAEAMGGYLRYRSPLDATVREAAILTVAALLDCEFELHAHEQPARDAGVDVDAIRSGRTNRLRDDVRVGVEIARRLVMDHRIPDDLFARARTHWDEPALLDLIALVGYYSFLAAVLNGFEVTPP